MISNIWEVTHQFYNSTFSQQSLPTTFKPFLYFQTACVGEINYKNISQVGKENSLCKCGVLPRFGLHLNGNGQKLVPISATKISLKFGEAVTHCFQ